MSSVAGLCSELSLRAGLPLIGSAGCYDSILAFELPAPWSPRLVGSRASDSMLDSAIVRIAAEAAGVRLLAVEPESASSESRVLCFRRGEGSFREYSRHEALVARDALARVLEQLAFEGECEVSLAPSAARDILVCTHGARDACCGRFGYPVYRVLQALAAADSRGERNAPVRVWRSSHLGGHRFAPTLLDLPVGRLFGRVSLADARGILNGGEWLAARVADLYRGRSALPESAQIVERALWMHAGAAFDGSSVSTKVEERGGIATVSMQAALVDGRVLEARGEVALDADGALRTPVGCGRDPEPDTPWKLLTLEVRENGTLDNVRRENRASE